MLGEIRTGPNAVIASGQSLSSAIDLGDGGIIAIQMPSSWTSANLTFQASSSLSGTYNDVYDSSGTEVSITAGASRYILLPPTSFAGLRFIKIRSGTTGSATNQAAVRTLTTLVRKLA